MKLQRLELSGFKSFADPIDFPFDEGVIAIVGPNGCGKSNISDAVRWVLGEQSAKVLRGVRMEEVIFQGAATRRPVNVAEVSLIFDNADGQLPVAYREVAITRRLTRAGVSDYLLNRAPVRLRDIQDLLRGTGLGSDAGAVIEARMIDALLSDKAEERRSLFEEAAEIGLYRDRKRSTERRLEETAGDLTRLEDVIAEVQTQVRSLARQRGKAERYTRHVAERYAIAAGLARLELERFGGEEGALASRAEALATELPAARAGLDDGERERERLVQARHTAEAQRTELDRRLAGERIEMERLEGDLHVGDERLRNARQRRGRAVDERSRAQARAEQAARERRAASEERHAAEEERSAVQGELSLRTEHERSVRDELARRRATVRELEESLRTRLETLRALEGERTALERELAGLRDESERVASHQTTIEGKLHAAREQAARLDREGQRVTALAQEAAAEVEHSRHAVAEIREREAELRSRRRATEDTHAQCLARRDALRRLEQDRVGLAPAARRLLADRGRFDGAVLGPLSDFLRPARDDAGLVERLLGEWVHAVLVRDADAVDAIRRWHGETQPGPLVLLPVRPGPRPAAGADPTAGRVRAAAPAADWASALLAGHEVLETSGQAFRRENGAVVLTAADEPSGPLQRRAELEAASHDAEQAAARVASLDRELSTAADRLLATEAALIDATQQADQAREAERVSRVKAEDGARAQEHLEREWREVQSQATRVGARLEEVRARLAVIDRELHQGEVERARLDERLGTERAALESIDAEQETARERRVHWQVEEAQVVARLEGAAGRERVAAEQAGEAEQLVASLSAELADLDTQSATLEQQVQQWREALGERRAALSQLEAACEDAAHEVAQADERLAAVERRLTEARHRVDVLAEEGHRLELQRSELAGRRRALTERIEVEWRKPIREILAHPEPTSGDLDTLRAEHERLREILEGMGPVNQLAVDEHAEETRRLEFLMTQRDDLVQAKKSLEQAAREIDQTARRLFLDTFTQIREHFHHVFSTLFEGGECDMQLADDSDPLGTEIEIRAAPRGKRVQHIHLLSSGERTLVAASLLFAIFLTKPSPFCVLDEVDAPLDDANVGRFVRLLEEFKDETQFIVITHNPRTMQAADAVYGVTMQEPGVSTIVGVRLGEVEPV